MMQLRHTLCANVFSGRETVLQRKHDDRVITHTPQKVESLYGKKSFIYDINDI